MPHHGTEQAPPFPNGTPQTLAQRLRNRLQALDRAGLRRSLHAPRGIDLASNDYLDLATHPHLKEAMSRAACEQGTGSTGSRLLRGEREATSRLEARFASFKGAERALYFSSGYLANLAVLTAFPEPGDTIVSDQSNHASLIDGCRLTKANRVIVAHNDPAIEQVIENNQRDDPTQQFLVVESLYSMEGDFAPLPELAALAVKTGAALIVDEAHAVGIYGQRGSGWIEECGLDHNQVFIAISTAGKALGVAGAFVTGSEDTIEYLLQTARPFIFSTAPPPPVIAAVDASLDVIEAEPERRHRVRHLARYLRALLREELRDPSREGEIEVAQSDSPIVPVILGSNTRAMSVAASLQREGFDVRAVRPPTVPEGTARLRISVNAGLDEAILAGFVGNLKQALQEVDRSIGAH